LHWRGDDCEFVLEKIGNPDLEVVVLIAANIEVLNRQGIGSTTLR